MAFPSTFVDIQTAVIAKGRLEATDDLAKVKDFINQAYYRACVETDYYENSAVPATLTANQTSVTVPATVIGVEYIVPTGSDGAQWGPMEEVPFQEMLELRAWAGGTIPTGAPSRYCFREATTNTIEIWPNAAGGEVLTFYGYALPTALSGDGDTTIFPEPYATMVLQYGALVEAGIFKKDLIMSDQYQGQYQDWLERFRGFRNSRRGARVETFKIDKQRPYPKGNSVDTGVF